MVQVPVGVSQDRLIGGVDFGRTIAEGRRRVAKGLLAEAHGGFICVEHLELLDTVNLRHLLTALDSGVVRIERDGISASHEARFALIGTLHGWDTEAAPALKDRVGLIVEHYEAPSDAERAEVLDRSEASARARDRFDEDFATQTRELRLEVMRARSRLSSIKMDRVQRSRLIGTALELGIESSRADLLAARAARASAALRGVNDVGEDDLKPAVEYVLIPRAGCVERERIAPQPASGADDDRRPERIIEQGEPFGSGEKSEELPDRMEDAIIGAQDCLVPVELVNSGIRAGRPLDKAWTRSGRRVERTESTHGRYVSAVPAADGSKKGKRIAIDATLRAAAPYQRIRRTEAGSNRQKTRVSSDLSRLSSGLSNRGRKLGRSRSAPAHRDPKGGGEKARIIIKPVDLRIKKLKHRSGALFIFLVDTSGSMAVGRIGHAKGVMIRMLRQAYLNRDRVALIAFRGTTVEIVLEPTSSIELARRAIESMPVGGGTPLAAGLGGAIALAERANKKVPGKTVLLVFTDGRVNVPLRPLESSGKGDRDPVIRAELQVMGQELARRGIRTVLIDTASWVVKGGKCASIAETIGASYCRLPGPARDALYRQLSELRGE
jgi:magnesium chelatase subunit D